MIKIHNQDCIVGMQEQIKAKSIKTIIADPPYFQGLTHNGSKATFDDLNISKYFFVEFFKEAKRILRDDGFVYFFTDWRGYAFYYPIMNEYLQVKNMICWNKGAGAGNKYTYSHELILFHCSNSASVGSANVWSIDGFSNPRLRAKEHQFFPTQKPSDVIRKMLYDTTKEGDLVCDPFSGSGTTADVCRELKRDFIGFEYSEANFKVIQERFKREKQKRIAFIEY